MVADNHTVPADDMIVSSIDSTASSDEYVIADISADDAWLSIRVDDAPTLSTMR